MTSLDDAFDAGRRRRRLAQLVAGASFVLAGAVAFGLGFARVSTDAIASAGAGDPLTTSAGFALGSLVLPAAFVALRTRFDADRGGELLMPGGLLVVGAALGIVGSATITGSVPGGALAWVLAGTYAGGVGLVVGSFLAAGLESAAGSSGGAISYRRTTARHDGPVPADGGQEDDDLDFPLDEE